MKLVRTLILFFTILVLGGQVAVAQKKSEQGLPGRRVIKVEGGRRAVSPTAIAVVDTTMAGLSVDSLRVDSLAQTNRSDSLGRATVGTDTTLIGGMQPTDSTIIGANASLLTAKNASDSTKEGENLLNKEFRKRFRITQDTIKAGSLTLISMVAPGFGQIYNRQWWKMPIIYAGLGGFLTAGIIANNRYLTHRSEYQRLLNLHVPDYVANEAKINMNNAGTLRTAMFVLAGATYLYSITDATFNYRGKVNPIRKATTLAALFPGAGFIYTKTYWRIPIYYGAGAALATVIDYNHRSYVRFNNAYTAITDNDPTTIDEFNGRYSADMLKNVKDSYRRNRDLAIIGTVAVYLISIVDTHVVATLKNWDMDEDLSIKVEPAIIDNNRPAGAYAASFQPVGVGVSLKVNF